MSSSGNLQPDQLVRLFAMSNQIAEHELDRIEAEFAVDLRRGHSKTVSTEEVYYPQIESAIRAEAAQMAPHYEIFYSLEKTIRALVRDVLSEEDGATWWSKKRIPEQVLKECEKRMKREVDTGTTLRSTDPLDFSTFGELGGIITFNWDLFGGQFTSVRAVERVLGNLNTLRGPVAHCSPLAEDEVVRLQLSVRDWFRLME